MHRTTAARIAFLALVGAAVSFAQPPQPAPSPAPPPTPPPARGPAPAAQPTAQPAAQPPGGAAAPGPTAENAAAAGEMTPEMNATVERGLAAVAGMQGEDGSFGVGPRYGKNVAVTSLCCLALLGDGNIPGRGEYGEQVKKGLEFVLASSAETGLLSADAGNGPMYGHGFATLFLGEVYGMTQGGGDTALSGRVHEALVRAVRLIERTQNSEGGWRYNPVPYDADVSVTICQVMALRSARNAGLEVPKETIDRAVEYVRKCQNPDGGFRYQLNQGMSAWPRSAAGVATLYYAGIYQDDAIDKGLRYLVERALPGNDAESRLHYYYGHYYAVQTMYLSGGDKWAAWWPGIRQELITKQNPDGSWSDATAGTAYGTAMALIILQMPKRYLPIFQK